MQTQAYKIKGNRRRNNIWEEKGVYRTQKCGWKVTKVAVEGAKLWCSMSPEERKQFYVEACKLRLGKRGKDRLRKMRKMSRRRR
ncbi:hypothetical protein JTB14_027414 [Gonioctena quinquepunctata]|nr:hypothetical protein JTB14_027414 [Gonioctena quinquepunctata]